MKTYNIVTKALKTLHSRCTCRPTEAEPINLKLSLNYNTTDRTTLQFAGGKYSTSNYKNGIYISVSLVQ